MSQCTSYSSGGNKGPPQVNTDHPTGPAQIPSTVLKISIHSAEVGVPKDMSEKRKSRSGSPLSNEIPLSDVVIEPELSSDHGYSIKQKNELERRIKELEYINEVLKAKCRQYHTNVNKTIRLSNAAQYCDEILAERAD